MADLLIVALVPPKYRALYEDNAIFNFKVNSLAALLPQWIDGLAIGAVEEQDQLDRAVLLSKVSEPLLDHKEAEALLAEWDAKNGTGS